MKSPITTTYVVLPEGWKLVPIEPTEAMIDALDDMDIYWSYRADGTPGMPEDVYRAMLAAAPPPPKE